VVLPEVFDPALFFSSELLIDAVAALVRPGSSVLDLGTGSGVGALASARAGARRVVAVDIDAAAVRCARVNVELHGLAGTIDVRHGDLFSPLTDERFELVCFNPPYLSGGVSHGLERALIDPGDTGKRFAEGLAAHLAPDGVGIIVLSSHGRRDRYLDPLAAAGFTALPIRQRDRGSETLTSWQLLPEARSAG
jgi:release factor glutamine methyltransferase